MRSTLFRLTALGLALLLGGATLQGGDKTSGVTVDKQKRTVTIAAKIAPRKLPNLQQIYPIEVIATYPAPKGNKAHETVVTFDAKPSEIHKALTDLGLKAGKPALGENGVATGPEVRIALLITDADGKTKKVPIEETLVQKKSGKPLPPLKWLFTGSAFKNPDPEKDDKVYGADLSGTLITVFPVTDDTVIQSNLSIKLEPTLKLETNAKVLPKEGTTVRLVIEVP